MVCTWVPLNDLILFPLGGMSGENLPLEIAYLDGTSEMIK